MKSIGGTEPPGEAVSEHRKPDASQLVHWSAAVIALVAMTALTAWVVDYFVSAAPVYFATPECSGDVGLPCRDNDSLLMLVIVGGLLLVVVAGGILVRVVTLTIGFLTRDEHERRAIVWTLVATVPVATSAVVAGLWEDSWVAAPVLFLAPGGGMASRLGIDVIVDSVGATWAWLAALSLAPLVTLRWSRVHFFACIVLATLAAVVSSLTLLPPVLILYAAVLSMSGAHSLSAAACAGRGHRDASGGVLSP